jgi:TetR/AcrR family transcriptional regulator
MPSTIPERRLSAEDRREQILHVAAKLFSRQGFSGTRTREIAEAAGVNEAIIFRHFPKKEDLYWAVIENRVELAKKRPQLKDRLKPDSDDREVLTTFAEEIINRQTTDYSVTRLLIYSGLEQHELSERLYRTYIADFYDFMAGHIRLRIKQGVYRDNVDPLLAARALWSMVAYHTQIQELFGGKRYQTFDPHHVASTIVDLWLAGVRAPGSCNGKPVEGKRKRS